ncbi:MAG: 30S ribosomal protein S18 [Firmicutes bacterium]|nr:30S ribosomal protein S18 [Bacillota bacterium]
MNKSTLDYKDVNRLRKYLTQNGKIISRRQTGLCARHQREVTNAIKRARNMSLI